MVGILALGMLALCGLVLYFLPALVAKSRCHPNTPAIFLLNLFLGWTFLGWVVSLVWSFTRPAVRVFYAPASPYADASARYPKIGAHIPTILPPVSTYPGRR